MILSLRSNAISLLLPYIQINADGIVKHK